MKALSDKDSSLNRNFLLKCARWSRLDLPVKKTYGYRQRDEATRAEFLAHLGDLKAPHLVYVDESGMDERDDYGYGYSKAGERLHALKSGRRQGRII